MSFKSAQRVIHRIGNVENWLNSTSLENRRIRMLDVQDQGKDRPDFVPQSDGGDVVVVVNADKAVFTGKKMQDKIYYRHMGKPGNLRESTPEQLKELFGGAELVWKAVSGMLPKNKLRKGRGIVFRHHYKSVAKSAGKDFRDGAVVPFERLSRLLVYNDDQHDFDESFMFPLAPPERIMRPNKQRWNLPEGFTPLNIHAYYSLWKGADDDWERKAQDVESAQESEAQELLSSGWIPPVQVDEDISAHTRRLMQGMRIQ